ncbi:MAG: J domain-containing protein [Armatimonadota bacterium]
MLRSYISTAEDRVGRIAAADEEFRLSNARKQGRDEIDSAILLPGNTAQTRMPAIEASPTRLAADYQLLGVKPGGGLEAVEAAWRRLALRADPKRFHSGSEEEKKAASLLNSINDAYARIREELDPTEGRFGQLEL